MISLLSGRAKRLLCYPGAVLILTLGGLILRPLCAAVRTHELQTGLQLPLPATTDSLSKQLAIFSLGGLRTLAAEVLAMDATSAWLQQDWPRARNRWQQITTLCPQRASYWNRAARDMSKNAVAFVNSRKELSEHQRAAMAQEYLDSAEQFYLQGIAHNPDNILLQLDLAAFYEDLARRPQFGKAVAAYEAALQKGASEMYRRWVFYNLCRIRGREHEAWDLGRQLFAQKRHHTPSVRCLLFALQHKLELPSEQRYTVSQLFGSEEKAYKQLRSYLHNTLRFPINGVADYLRTHRLP